MSNQSHTMRRAGWGLIAIGIVFAASAAAVPLHVIAVVFLKFAYWPFVTVPGDLAVPGPLLVAITGGLTAGLGGMLWAVGTHVAPLSSEAAEKVVKYAAWSWFVTDSTASILVGAPFNVVLNLSFLAVMLWSSRQPRSGISATA